MPWIETANLTAEILSEMDDHDLLQIYNGFDICTTKEIHEVLSEQLRSINAPGPAAAYKFKRAMQGPAMDMMCRGIRIDRPKQMELIGRFRSRREFLELRLNEIGEAMGVGPLNARSPVQLQPIFYQMLGIPPITVRMKGETKTPMNMEVLEKLCEFRYAAPIAKLVMEIRNLGKLISVLSSGIDADGRMRTSYNVAATETERWSSSENAFGTGTNFQNITDEMREIFISDPGYKMAYVDLSQAESFIVGLAIYRCTGDDSYLAACESGDLHTGVARMAWQEREWTDDPKVNRALADELFYRHFSYRDMSKRLGHATNYRGSAWQLARILRIIQDLIEDFQRRYIKAFKINLWHNDVARRLQTTGELTTLLGNRRQFFGRLFDEQTLKEAIAYEPQSVVGQLLNLGMYRVYVQRVPLRLQLLAQVHDAILVQYPAHLEAKILPQVQALMNIPLSVEYNGVVRTTTIPNEAAVGWNWAKHTDSNPDGLKKWTGHDERKRTGNPTATIMDRRVC